MSWNIVWWIVGFSHVYSFKVILWSRRFQHSVLAGGLNLWLEMISWTGLQSVRSLKWFPNKYTCNILTVYTIASASLSACEYRCSTGGKCSADVSNNSSFTREVVDFWANIADNCVGDASMVKSVSLSASKYAMTLAPVRSHLISLKEWSCSAGQWNSSSFFISSLNGVDMSLNLGINIAQ